MEEIKNKAGQIQSYQQRMYYGANEDYFYQLVDELIELIHQQK